MSYKSLIEPRISLERAIDLMDAQVGELYGVSGVIFYAEDILYYLKEFKNTKEHTTKVKDDIPSVEPKVSNELEPVPVRCGCGGEVEVYSMGNSKLMAYYIQCEDCGIKTSIFRTITDATRTWNKAMSERTAKVKDLERRSETSLSWEGTCTECGSYTMHDMNYCFHCGVKLDWSGNE